MPNWIVRLNHTKSSDSLSYEKSLECVVWGNEFTDTLCIQTYTEEKFHFYMNALNNGPSIVPLKIYKIYEIRFILWAN